MKVETVAGGRERADIVCTLADGPESVGNGTLTNYLKLAVWRFCCLPDSATTGSGYREAETDYVS